MTAAELAYKTSATQAIDPDDLVTKELSQVYYIASRIRERLPQHVELEELVSAGTLGLIEAARSFDNSKNVQFRTYAKFRIRGAIVDSLRDTDWGSRYMRRKGREIAEATRVLQAKIGRQPSEPEIAVEMGVEVSYLRRLIAQLDSLQLGNQNVGVASDRLDSIDVIESAPNLDDPDPFELCLDGERKAHLAEAISKLTEREQLILSLYYREELTMKEIAKVVGVALSRVSQIRQEIIIKLRHYLEPLQSGPIPITTSRGAYFERA
jgi:RNA polymerase sigma factor FliA